MTDNETLAVADMWYGVRRFWRDPGLPLGMDVTLANPAYADHLALSFLEEQRERRHTTTWEIPEGIVDWRKWVGKAPEAVQEGAILTDLLATWLAGHEP